MHAYINLHQILLIAALVFSILLTAGIPSPPRFQWLGATLMCLILAFVFGV
jgi:hypothetical protein